jgi:hypothetical protein
MAGPGLRTNIAGHASGTLADTNTVHTYVNELDTEFLAPSTDGHVLTWDSTSGTWKPEAVPAGVHAATETYISEVAGASNNARLGTFIAALTDGTLKSSLVLDGLTNYSFTTKRTINDGFALVGANRTQDQARSSLPVAQTIVPAVSMGGMFALPSVTNLYGCYFGNLCIDGNTGNRLLDGHASTVLQTTTFHNISCQDSAGIMGTDATKMLLTACNFSGFWNVNNIKDSAFVIGGSDLWLAPDILLLDSPPGDIAVTNYMSRFQFISNTWVKNWYVTAEACTAFEITGNAESNSFWIKDTVIEGRNDGAPSPGALIRQSGGQVTVESTRFAFAMDDPTTTGRSPTDAGVHHMTGGTATLDNVTYDRKDAVAETVPILYANGSSTIARATNITAVGEATWTGKPRVQAAGGATITVDDTVEAVADSSSTIIHLGVLGSAQNLQTGTSYTVLARDAGKTVEQNNAGTCTVTFPVLYKGHVSKHRRYGAGAVNFTNSGTTLRGLSSIANQYEVVTATYRTSTEVIISVG